MPSGASSKFTVDISSAIQSLQTLNQAFSAFSTASAQTLAQPRDALGRFGKSIQELVSATVQMDTAKQRFRSIETYVDSFGTTFKKVTTEVGGQLHTVETETTNYAKAQKQALATVEDEFRRLKTAYSGVVSAMKTGDAGALQMWSAQVQQLSASLESIRTKLAGGETFGLDGTALARLQGIMADLTTATIQYNSERQKVTNDQNAQIQAQQLQAVQQQYQMLTTALNQYLAAYRSGNTEGQNYWQSQITAIQAYFDQLKNAGPQTQEISRFMELAAQAVAKYNTELANMKAKDDLQQHNAKIRELEQAYQQLSNAYQNYHKAFKADDQAGMASWQTQITATQQTFDNIKNIVTQMGLTEAEQNKINALILQASQLAAQNEAAERAVTEEKKRQQTVMNSINSAMNYLISRFILTGIRQLWRDAKSFAKEYYDTLNEIRVVTGKSQEEANALGESFRAMAAEMSVSATEIADAATLFYRQGLDDNQVTERMEATIQYAKVAGVEVNDAAQIVTAAVNSMGLDATRVVDVLVYLGDHAGTSGQEVGTAMQKAAAAAKSAGVEFEWLGAYIATISETTRVSAESIGTALNSMMARLHSIKQKGFNDEDTTKVNDIAKALNSVGIALMDSEGNWRRMDVIFDEIAQKWDTLSDKQQSYIATTLAGTRAQNYFLALMNDMAKGAEGGSRAYELYAGAMESAGTTAEKYAVWQESISAAQERLTVAFQNFYALLQQNVFTGFFNNMAGLIAGLTGATDAAHGLNLILPIVIGAIVLFIEKLKGAGGLAALFSGAFHAHPFILTAAGVMILVTAIGALVKAATPVQRTYEDVTKDVRDNLQKVKDSLAETQRVQKEYTDKAADLEKLRKRYVELTTQTKLTADEQSELNSIINQLKELYPDIAFNIDQATGRWEYQQEVVDHLNGSIENYLKLAREKGMADAREAFNNVGTVLSSMDEMRSKIDEHGFVSTVLGMTDSKGKALYDYNAQSGVFTHQGQTVSAQDMLPLVLPYIMSQHGYVPSSVRQEGWGASANAMYEWLVQNRLWEDEKGNNPFHIQTDIGEKWFRSPNEYASYLRTSEGMTMEAAAAKVDEVIQGVLSRVLTNSLNNYALKNAEYQSLMEDTKTVYGSHLAAFKNPDLDLPQTIMDNLESEYNSIAQGIDWSNSETLGAQFLNAADKIYKLYGDAANFADIVNNSPEAVNLKDAEKEWNKARDNYIRNPSATTKDKAEEAMSNYNDAVGAWNEMLSELDNRDMAEEFSLDKMEMDLEDLATAAQEATEALDETAKAEQHLAEQRELKSAQTSGFKSYLQNLKDTSVAALTGEDGTVTTTFDPTVFRQQYDKIPSYIRAEMEKNYTFLKPDSSFWNGTMTPEDQIRNLNAALDSSSEVAEKFAMAYGEAEAAVQGVTEAAEEGTPTLSDYWQGFLTWLQGGGDASTFLTAITDDNVAAQMQQQYEKWAAEAAQFANNTGGEEGTQVWDEAYIASLTASINEQINGTAENIKLQFMEVGDTANATVQQQLDGVNSLIAALSTPDGFNNFKTAWNDLDKNTKKSLKNMTGWTDDFINSLDGSQKSVQGLQKTLIGLRLEKMESLGQVMTGTSKAFTAAQKGGQEFASAMKTIVDRANTLASAQGAYNTVLNWSGEETKEYTAALTELHNATGISEASLRDGSGMSAALESITEQANIAKTSVAALANALIASGSISVDAGPVANGYINIGAAADDNAVKVSNLVNEVLKILGATIRFEKNDEGGGKFIVEGLGNGKTGGSGYTPPTGKGGGGGGGGNKKQTTETKESTKISKWISGIMWQFDQIKDMMSRLDTIKSTYQTEGYLTGIINILNQEINLSKQKLTELESVRDQLKTRIDEVKEEMSKVEVGSEKYQDLASTLGTLQDKYAEVDKEILKTQGDISSYTKEIEKNQQGIRNLQMGLENTVLAAIEARDKREKESFEAKISLEDKIISVIKKRYETERDEALKTSDAKIEALKKESDALKTALDERKKQQQDEDKQKQLKELQDQYARIIADPTRAKEAKEIQKKIVALQEDMAWDAAEKEVEDRQKAINKEVEEEQKKRDKTAKYYEDLLSDPRNFAEEAAKVMAMTNTEIVEWLKKNDDEYLKSTDLTRKKLEDGWSETMDTIAMKIKTKWAEVYSIMAGGDEAIIEFLKANDPDYLAASETGKRDKEIAWRQQIKDLKNALYDINPEVSPHDFLNYFLTYYGSGKGTPQSSTPPKGKGQGSGDGKKKDDPEEKSGDDKSSPKGSLLSLIYTWIAEGEDPNNPIEKKKKMWGSPFKEYASGGIIDYTGPAWVDGTPQMPEYIMNHAQMESVRGLIHSLGQIATVSVPTLMGMTPPTLRGGNSGIEFGDIIVNVNSLNTDEDYDDMAERVMDAISDKMNRGVAVGGVRMGTG